MADDRVQWGILRPLSYLLYCGDLTSKEIVILYICFFYWIEAMRVSWVLFLLDFFPFSFSLRSDFFPANG
jgi:hypothetical protein